MAKRSVIDQLPEAVRHEFERKLVENGFADYQALSEWLQQQGYEISRSAAHWYGQKVQRRFAAIKSSTEAARLIAEGAADEGDKTRVSFVGEDFARSGDRTVIVPLLQQTNLSLKPPFVLELGNMPFAQQEQIMKHLLHGLRATTPLKMYGILSIAGWPKPMFTA